MTSANCYYLWEKYFFVEAFSMKLDERALRLIFSKLKRDFKIRNTVLRIAKMKPDHGLCYPSNGRGKSAILLGMPTTLGVICHELAHVLDRRRPGRSRHDKRLLRIMSKLIHHCIENEYLKDDAIASGATFDRTRYSPRWYAESQEERWLKSNCRLTDRNYGVLTTHPGVGQRKGIAIVVPLWRPGQNSDFCWRCRKHAASYDVRECGRPYRLCDFCFHDVKWNHADINLTVTRHTCTRESIKLYRVALWDNLVGPVAVLISKRIARKLVNLQDTKGIDSLRTELARHPDLVSEVCMKRNLSHNDLISALREYSSNSLATE